MGLYEDFLPYRDKHGLQQNVKGETHQNGALCTIEYLMCLLADKNTPQEVKDAEIERINDVLGDLWTTREPVGYSQRSPESIEIDSMDNAGALAVHSALFDNRAYAVVTLNLGWLAQADGTYRPEDKYYYYLASALNFFRGPKNFWNNENINKFCREAWWGRSPGFLGLLEICALGYTSPFKSFALLVGQMLSLHSKGSSSLKLAFVNWQLLKNKNWFWSLAYKYWVRELKNKYPDGMHWAYKEWYQDPGHPMRTDYSRGLE